MSFSASSKHSLSSPSVSTPASRKAAIEHRITQLTLECEQLEEQLQGEDPEKIVKRHIELLHLYNERKDATQIMIGKIAALEQCTVQEIQSRLGIEGHE